jgi:hypothetical protein
MSKKLAFSVDLEPNKDNSLEDIGKAMEWFDKTIPRGTIFTTFRIAKEMPDLVSKLSKSNEIGVHVHPKEFGYEHDKLAELGKRRQRELIDQTRMAITQCTAQELTTFRAGRHSINSDTIEILPSLGFELDASININYNYSLPNDIVTHKSPFILNNGIVEVPTTYIEPCLASLTGIRAFPSGAITATSSTLRNDLRGCSGVRAIESIFYKSEIISMYMHPYDATVYDNNIVGGGEQFRRRIEDIICESDFKFVTMSEVKNSL